MRGNIAFLAKFRRKLRTKNFEAHFNRKLRTIEKCSNVKKLRTAEPQPIFTGSYKKKECTLKRKFISLYEETPKPFLIFIQKRYRRGVKVVCKLKFGKL